MRNWILRNLVNNYNKSRNTESFLVYFESEVNEEGIQEIGIHSSDYTKQDYFFYIYDNRIYFNSSWDLDLNLEGTFESIDGDTKNVVFRYDSIDWVLEFFRDLKQLVEFYSCNL